MCIQGSGISDGVGGGQPVGIGISAAQGNRGVDIQRLSIAADRLHPGAGAGDFDQRSAGRGIDGGLQGAGIDAGIIGYVIASRFDLTGSRGDDDGSGGSAGQGAIGGEIVKGIHPNKAGGGRVDKGAIIVERQDAVGGSGAQAGGERVAIQIRIVAQNAGSVAPIINPAVPGARGKGRPKRVRITGAGGDGQGTIRINIGAVGVAHADAGIGDRDVQTIGLAGRDGQTTERGQIHKSHIPTALGVDKLRSQQSPVPRGLFRTSIGARLVIDGNFARAGGVHVQVESRDPDRVCSGGNIEHIAILAIIGSESRAQVSAESQIGYIRRALGCGVGVIHWRWRVVGGGDIQCDLGDIHQPIRVAPRHDGLHLGL